MSFFWGRAVEKAEKAAKIQTLEQLIECGKQLTEMHERYQLLQVTHQKLQREHIVLLDEHNVLLQENTALTRRILDFPVTPGVGHERPKRQG